MVGDNFLKETYPALDTLVYQTGKDKDKELIPPFMHEYYNIRSFENKLSSGVKYANTRIVNSLIDVINNKELRLPKYLYVICDKDILNDTTRFEKDEDAIEVMRDTVSWMVRKIDLSIKRKRLSRLEKRPGSVSGYTTTIIFIRMIRRVGSFHEGTRMARICELRSRFNDALNTSVAKYNHRIMTINSCNTYNHFDRLGMLSPKGKEDYWAEVDDLLYRFEKNKVKLLPQKGPNQ